MRSVNAVVLPTSPAYGPSERVTTLHTVNHRGEHSVLQASKNSWFTEIYASDSGVIGFLAPVYPLVKNHAKSGRRESNYHVRGLFVLSTDFDSARDWVLAAEEPSYSCEGKAHVVLGNDQFDSAESIVDWVVSSRRACPQHAVVEEASSKSSLLPRLIGKCLRTEAKSTSPQTAQWTHEYLPTIQRFSLMSSIGLPLPQLKPLVYGE